MTVWRIRAEYTSVECPHGFRLSSPASCYQFVRERVTWTEAQRRCSLHNNAHLLALETPTEQRFIYDHLTKTRSMYTGRRPTTYHTDRLGKRVRSASLNHSRQCAIVLDLNDA